MFQKLYTKTLGWSRHRHAEKYLSFVSFADSSYSAGDAGADGFSASG
jgi:membrane protein YqaA with SNARE-associated domain